MIPFIKELAMQEFERRKRNDTIIRGAMAAISIGLAIASFGSMSGLSAVILGGLSVGVSGIDAYMTYQEYDHIAPAGNTTFDPEKVLTDEDPSVVWVIASVAGALADGVQLVKLAKQIATLSKVNKALALQNLEKVTAKLAGKVSEKELANITNNLHILEGLRKTRQQLAHSIVKQSKDKLDLPAIEQAVDIYMFQHSDELIKAAKSGSFKLTKEAQEEVLGVYKLGSRLDEVTKQTHEALIEGGVKYKFNGNTIKYYTKSGKEFAYIEGGKIKSLNDKWPHPNEYLDEVYIKRHLTKFESGGSYLVPKEALDRYGRDPVGRPDGQFVMSKLEMDELLAKAKGDLTIIEEELGIPEGLWKNKEIVRIDISNPKDFNIRIPTGNEAGANELWLPGGKLPTGYLEAVIDVVNKGNYKETLTNLK